MTRPEQKRREFAAAEQLCSLLPEIPRNAVIDPSDEPLDIVVTLPTGRRIGIEVTAFVRDRSAAGSKLDAYQEMSTKIARAAEAAYENVGGRYLYCQLHFKLPFVCAARDVEAIGARIAEVLRLLAPTVEATVEVRGGESELPLIVEKLVVQPLALPMPQFALSYSDKWEYLSSAHVEATITEKAKKIHSYRAKADEVWLLVNVNRARMSAWVEPPEYPMLSVSSDVFDRVFVLFGSSRMLEVTLGA